jgi:hypothetical protein
MSTSTEQVSVTSVTTKQGWRLPALVIGLAVIWWLVWGQLQNVADRLTYSLIGLQPETRLAESVNFFLYDVPKILLLLAGKETVSPANPPGMTAFVTPGAAQRRLSPRCGLS